MPGFQACFALRQFSETIVLRVSRVLHVLLRHCLAQSTEMVAPVAPRLLRDLRLRFLHVSLGLDGWCVGNVPHVQLALAVRVLAHFPAFDLHALDGVLQFLRFLVYVPFG